MLVLHGFSSSNYYNVVKLALLEKQLSFQEALVYPGAGERYRPDYLALSPLGKVPCLQTEHGPISESRCILDYLERTYPERPLYPTNPFAVAKLLELTQVVDLYLELAARRLLPNLFGQKAPPERIAGEVREALAKGRQALVQLASFDEFALGSQFTAADIALATHIPAVRFIAEQLLSYDPFADVPGLDAYLARLAERPTVKRVRADRDADRPKFFAHIKQLFGGKSADASP